MNHDTLLADAILCLVVGCLGLAVTLRSRPGSLRSAFGCAAVRVCLVAGTATLLTHHVLKTYFPYDF